MKKELLATFYAERELSDAALTLAVKTVEELETKLIPNGGTADTCSVDDTVRFVDELIAQGKNTPDRLLGLIRYFYLAGNTDPYIYLSTSVGTKKVLENISKRLADMEGDVVKAAVMDKLDVPPLGSSPEKYPALTKQLMNSLCSALPKDRCRHVLAGNMHGIPQESFERHKALFKKAESMDEFLKAWHESSIAELEEYFAEGKVWYEQTITRPVIEYVRANQEVLGGVRVGNKVFMTKIPYNPDKYLSAATAAEKRRFLCHCPFVRTAVEKGEERDIPPDWCYCSGGFEKVMLEAVFGEELEVELLETPLKGDEHCRFAVTVPDRLLK